MLTQISNANRLVHADGSYPRQTALEADLLATVRGEVRFDNGSRAVYSTDASNYRQIPIGVVLPRDKEDVINTMAVCRRHGAPC
jgi:FAD/FMN-containing dehydrogenase